MTAILIPLLIVCAALALWAWIALRRAQLEVARIRAEREAIVVEERKMFDFLHGLGEALAGGASLSSLHRLIAKGATEVAGARGGAFYQFDERQQRLVPTYYSADCPPVVPLPERIVEQSKSNPLTLGSYLKLHAVPVGEGVVGSAFKEDAPQFIEALRAHPDFKGHRNPQQGGVATMMAPLRYQDQPLGLLLVANSPEEGGFCENDFDVFSSLADQSAFALGNAMVHEEASEKRRLDAELHNASEIQRVLLPSGPPELDDYEFAAVNLAAKMVSGDYYDYVPIDDEHFGVVIGDVSGKGVPASLVTAMCRSVLRAEARGSTSPAEVLGSVNRLIFPDIREDMFISAIYLVLHRDSKNVTMARAGHSGILHFGKLSGEVTVHEPPGLAVGIDAGPVFSRVTQDFSFEVEPGDFLLLYTDGVTEAADAKGMEFGEDRLRKSFAKAAAVGSVEEVIGSLRKELEEFEGDSGQGDDITLIALKKRED